MTKAWWLGFSSPFPMFTAGGATVYALKSQWLEAALIFAAAVLLGCMEGLRWSRRGG